MPRKARTFLQSPTGTNERCQDCGRLYLRERLAEHREKQHGYAPARQSAPAHVAVVDSVKHEPGCIDSAQRFEGSAAQLTAVEARLVRCDLCDAMVALRNVERHKSRVHANGAAASRRTRARPSAVERKVVCGECYRSMGESEYDVHICRPRGVSVYSVRGGAPGLGRRH